MAQLRSGVKKPVLYRIPACPFSQRLEILLALKERPDAVDIVTVDITRPRPAALMALLNGSTALPILQTASGQVIKESLVILRYLDGLLPQPRVAQADPYRHAVEGMLTALAEGFCQQGYTLVMNQDPQRRASLVDGMLAQYASLNQFLQCHAPDGDFLFERFGWSEAVFTPLFMRFWFLDYYEGFELPVTSDYERVRRWRNACVAHPAAQQVSREQIIKLYYDYAKGAGNGSLLPNRSKSSFSFEVDWPQRPWPPADKYRQSASDSELGLV